MSDKQTCATSTSSSSAGKCPFLHEEPQQKSLPEQLSQCPTFSSGDRDCPFNSRAKDDMEDMFTAHSNEPFVRNVYDDSAIHGDGLMKSIMSHYTLVSKKSMAAQDDPILENPELASAMREGTKVVHRAAESSVFTKKFLKGDITKDEYGQYISSLYFIYSTMERLLRSHKNHPVLQNICFPTELEREQALLNDLEFYYGKERLPELTSPLSMTPAVKAYVQSLEAACSVDPLLLVAHSYSRYLGDLSGGQILARRLKKHVLNLEKDDASWDSEDGLHFYQFNNIGNHNQFKTLYRERLDTLQVNSRTKAMIVAEAIRSFELNIAVFDEIQAISDAKQLKPTMITDDVTKPTVSTWLANPLYVASAGIAVASVGLIAYQRYVRNA